MLTKRIIPCLDVKDGRTVKGTKFLDLRDAGDPVELAKRYSKDGADELIFLDIGATIEKRQALKELVERVAAELDIPFTVGGGIASIEDIDVLLSAGADKVSINSAAVRDPELISIASRNYGSQCIVIAIDAKKVGDHFVVFINGGRISTELDAEVWCRRAIDLGAGEILLTSMDADGTKNGFDIELTRRIASAVNVPVIASGGAGSPRDFVDVFTTASADAALAAGIFHFGEVEIPLLKDFLRGQGIPVRI